MAEYNEYLQLKENSHQTSVEELQSIDKGLADVKAGKTIPSEIVMSRLDKYVSDKLD
jgi:predicted transcriptional regulator